MAFASNGKGRGWARFQRCMAAACVVILAGVAALAQTASQTANDPAQQPASTQTQQSTPTQAQEIPDDPSMATPTEPPHAAPPPGLPARTDADNSDQPAPAPAGKAKQPTNPFGDQPAPQPTYEDTQSPQQPRRMPPIRTLPPGTTPRNQVNPKDDLYTISVPVNFVLVPVMVKDGEGRRVDGLLPKDFSVLENGKKQALSFFTTDPFELSVAIVLDMGLPDAMVQRVNQTYTSLVGAFSPYDEVALYTYSSTVSQVTDYTGNQVRLTAVFNQIKTERGANNGVPVLGGPMASGPTVNGVPVGGAPIQPVNTPPREAHVLNDAILRAALDLAQRDRTRRKVIFVISDGREMGSRASYNDVKRILLKNGIQVKGVALDTAALPIYSKLGKIHLPLQGVDNLLPRYVSATGGGKPLKEFTRNAIEAAYQEITNEARNQYTLGYTTRATASTTYRDIEVIVDKPSCKKYKNPCIDVFAKDGYYPAPPVRSATTAAPEATAPAPETNAPAPQTSTPQQ